ncbi:hypothetical protein HY626_03260 [Candidatus Uhrbacteria bacterium]|nr:hypothetical protein [Candidatus Uhrbacteria bacterium]
MDKDIKDMNELSRLLVPVYGFGSRDAAEAYVDAENGSDRIVAPQMIADRDHGIGYVMIPGWWSQIEAQILVERPDFRRTRPGPTQIWEKLRSADKQRPDDRGRPAFTSVLLIGGRRQFFRHHVKESRYDAPWWKRLDTGRRDCFAVFAHRDGSPLEPFRVIDNGKLNGARQTKTVSTARSGRVAIYSATTVYAKDGSINGNEARLLLAEFSVLDRDSTKDDMLRVTVVAQQHQFPSGAQIPEIDLSYQQKNGLDDAWVRLANEARNGFIRECSPVDEENEKFRSFHVRQRQLAAADDKKPYGEKFAERIRTLDWQAALRLVQEPWQFALVASVHGHRGEFSSDGGMYTIPYECVPKMVELHECSPERRTALQGMIGYASETSTSWNYRGD